MRFFDENAKYYSNLGLTGLNKRALGYISPGKTLLDIGGGKGVFSSASADLGAKVTLLDPSQSMLDLSKDARLEKMIGQLPNDLPKRKFDYIFMQYVLHHVTGKSIAESKRLVGQSLDEIHNRLDAGGLLFLTDEYEESYLLKTFYRTAVFYALKLQNKIGIKIPIKYFLLGLEVCFYTREEFESMLADAGFEIAQKEEREIGGILKYVQLLKNRGIVLYIAKPV